MTRDSRKNYINLRRKINFIQDRGAELNGLTNLKSKDYKKKRKKIGHIYIYLEEGGYTQRPKPKHMKRKKKETTYMVNE